MFGITFPLNLNVKYKAILLGACFLIVSIFVNHLIEFCIKLPEIHFLLVTFLGLCLFRDYREKTTQTLIAYVKQLVNVDS